MLRVAGDRRPFASMPFKLTDSGSLRHPFTARRASHVDHRKPLCPLGFRQLIGRLVRTMNSPSPMLVKMIEPLRKYG